MIATVAVTVLILIFTLWLPLETLARLTSLIILVIFATVNIALVRIKRRDTRSLEKAEHTYAVPLWVPIAGAIASAAFVLINLMELVGWGEHL